MKRLLILFFLISFNTWAQQVPSKIEFGGIKLHLSKNLQEELQKEVDMLTVSPKYFQIKVDRAKIYFPVIEKIFAEEGVPDDLKYLVLQESALIPDAVSVSNAVGYWQFKDFTAMEMGLRIDKHIDERMNIVSSSYAAARYLKKNNTYFDNWLYALQAYQMGAGGALKVVDDKYFGAKRMDLGKDTYWYVKKYLAHKIAFESAVDGNGETILNIYSNGANKSLKEIANETSVEYEQLLAYNVWLKGNRIPADKEYSVVLPLKHKAAVPIKAVDIKEAEEPSKIPEKVIIAEESKYPVFGTRKPLFSSEEVKTINGIPGLVAKNEKTLIDLAVRADMSLSKFMRINDLTIKNQPVKGQVYYLKRKKAKAPTYYHIVKEGESLWEISQRYGVRLNKLLLKNRLSTPKDIKPGLVLWMRHVRPEYIPAEFRETKKEQREKENKIVTVNKEKESNPTSPALEKEIDEPSPEKSSTADEVQVTKNEPEQIIEENVEEIEFKEQDIAVDNLSDTNNSLKSEAGNEEKQEINDPSPEPEKLTEFIFHKIEPGETYYSISKKYQVEVVDILNWNELNINDKLSIGQEVKILQQNPVRDKKEVVDLKTVAGHKEYHEVKEGDTLYQIARKYEVTIQEILEWNNKTDYSISTGEKLLIQKSNRN